MLVRLKTEAVDPDYFVGVGSVQHALGVQPGAVDVPEQDETKTEEEKLVEELEEIDNTLEEIQVILQQEGRKEEEGEDQEGKQGEVVGQESVIEEEETKIDDEGVVEESAEPVAEEGEVVAATEVVEVKGEVAIIETEEGGEADAEVEGEGEEVAMIGAEEGGVATEAVEGEVATEAVEGEVATEAVVEGEQVATKDEGKEELATEDAGSSAAAKKKGDKRKPLSPDSSDQDRRVRRRVASVAPKMRPQPPAFPPEHLEQPLEDGRRRRREEGGKGKGHGGGRDEREEEGEICAPWRAGRGGRSGLDRTGWCITCHKWRSECMGPDDWVCKVCGQHNWPSAVQCSNVKCRSHWCSTCQMPKDTCYKHHDWTCPTCDNHCYARSQDRCCPESLVVFQARNHDPHSR